MARFLVVQAGRERVGLGLELVREVVDVGTPRPVPAARAAMRGVMQLRERHVSLLHLGALLNGGVPPDVIAETAVIVQIGPAQGRPVQVALEVEGVEDVADRAVATVGEAPEPWGAGVWQVAGGLVTLIDSAALAAMITSSQHQAEVA